MIRDLVLDAQAAEPAVRQIDLGLTAEQPFRPNSENIADDKHPDHKYRIDRRATERRLVGLKLGVDPGQIEHGGDLAHQVVVRYNLVELELVEQWS